MAYAQICFPKLQLDEDFTNVVFNFRETLHLFFGVLCFHLEKWNEGGTWNDEKRETFMYKTNAGFVNLLLELRRQKRSNCAKTKNGTSCPKAPFSETKTVRFAWFPSLLQNFVESSRRSSLKKTRKKPICRVLSLKHWCHTFELCIFYTINQWFPETWSGFPGKNRPKYSRLCSKFKKVVCLDQTAKVSPKILA